MQPMGGGEDPRAPLEYAPAHISHSRVSPAAFVFIAVEVPLYLFPYHSGGIHGVPVIPIATPV